MSISKKIILVPLLLSSLNVSATTLIKKDLNIEQGLSGSFDLSLASKEGTTEQKDFLFDSILNYKKNKHSIIFSNKNRYGKINKERTANEQYYHVGYQFDQLINQYDFESFIEYEKDEFEFLTRKTLGSGLKKTSRTTDVYSGDFQMSYAGGALFDIENRHIDHKTKDENVRLYLSSNMTYLFKDKKTKVYLGAHYQPKIDDFSDFKTITNFGISSIVYGGFSIGFNYSVEYHRNYSYSLKRLSSFVNYSF